MTGKGGRRRSRRIVVAVIVVLAAGAAIAAVSGYALRDDGGKRPAGSTLAQATATVTRQTLADTQSESGELGYGSTTAIAGRLSGTVTRLPDTGAVVRRGEALYRVDDTPVVLLYGAMPAYRTLATGVVGADVGQFEENLAALGYTGFTVDDEYTGTTATAVWKWQKDLGLTGSGTVEPGRVVYSGGEVRVDAWEATVGAQLQPGSKVLTTTGTARVVTVTLDVSDQRMAKVGAAVTVKLPDGKTVQGKVARTATVIEAADNPQEDPKTRIEVGVTVDDESAVAGLDQATVTVGFTAAQRQNVLTVPVAALLALAEGGYGVEVVEGGATRIVGVRTGMFAAGRVEITGDGIAEGMTVGMPQ